MAHQRYSSGAELLARKQWLFGYGNIVWYVNVGVLRSNRSGITNLKLLTKYIVKLYVTGSNPVFSANNFGRFVQW